MAIQRDRARWARCVRLRVRKTELPGRVDVAADRQLEPPFFSGVSNPAQPSVEGLSHLSGAQLNLINFR